MNNKTLSKSLHLISSPISLLSIILLFVNDHILRIFWPSWITGKLGDFAWLLIAPFAFAAILAVIIPSSIKNHTKKVGYLSFSIVSILFIFGNSLESTNRFLIDCLEQVLFFQIQITRDPTDLVALLSCVLGWFLWNRNKQEIALAIRKRKGAFLISATALLTIANLAAVDFGIYCFEPVENAIIASSEYTNYKSIDGGETWEIYSGKSGLCGHYRVKDYQTVVGEGITKTRFKSGGPIEISTDSGISWQVEYQQKLNTQAQRSYYEKYREGNPLFYEGPLDAVVDPMSGNIIFAMGHEGVLIRRPDKSWQWAEVGSYKKVDYLNPNLYILLWGEGLLAIVNGMFIFVVLGFKQNIGEKGWKRIGKVVPAVIAWLSIGIASFVFPSAIAFGYGEIPSNAAIVVTLIINFVVFIVVFINTITRTERYPIRIRSLLGFAGAGIGLFFLPYLLWFTNLLPNYYFAPAIAFVLQTGMIIWGRHTIKNT